MNARKSVLIAARRSLIVLAVTVTVAVSVFVGTRYLDDRFKNQLLQLQQQEVQGEANLQQKQVDATTLQDGLAEYEVLQQQGMVGLADREGWVEQLITSRERLGLPNTLIYTLQPPKPLTQQDTESSLAATEPGTIDELTSGPLFHDLEFKILGIHEGELLDFLSAYQSQVKGRFRVNACSLTEPQVDGLSANCTLRFFTLSGPGSSAKAGPP